MSKRDSYNNVSMFECPAAAGSLPQFWWAVWLSCLRHPGTSSPSAPPPITTVYSACCVQSSASDLSFWCTEVPPSGSNPYAWAVPQQKARSGERSLPQPLAWGRSRTGKSCRLKRGTLKASILGHYTAQLALSQLALFTLAAECVLLDVTLIAGHGGSGM